MAGTEHAGAQFDSFKAEREAKASHAAASKEIWKDHQGQVQDGHTYTGASILYKNEHNSHEHVGWSGELHGTWGGENDKADPALSLLRSAGPTKVGGVDYQPSYALLHSKHPDLPNVNVTHSQWLQRDGARDIRDREQNREYKQRKQAGR